LKLFGLSSLSGSGPSLLPMNVDWNPDYDLPRWGPQCFGCTANDPEPCPCCGWLLCSECVDRHRARNLRQACENKTWQGPSARRPGPRASVDLQPQPNTQEFLCGCHSLRLHLRAPRKAHTRCPPPHDSTSSAIVFFEEARERWLRRLLPRLPFPVIKAVAGFLPPP
jgi:hypothetical protein